jgi:hypothetical protein
MGHRICDTILDFCDPDQVKVKQVLEELEILIPEDGSMSESDDDTDQDSDLSGDGDGDNT